MRKIVLYGLLIIATSLAVSCGNEYNRKPGRVYAPDMVYSRAVDYYNGTEKIEAEKGVYTKQPAPHTIAREQPMPDYIGANDTTLAKARTCSIELTEADVVEGKRLYLIQCGICHGEQLDGNGPLYSSGKFAAMPANLKSGAKLNYTQGQIYHAIMHGKNTMGSYASQLDEKQRWKVVAYIKKVQSENGGEAFTMVKTKPGNDSVQVNATKKEVVKEKVAEAMPTAKN